MSTQTPQETTSPPAAWYPDTNRPGFERWFDGTQWTDQTRPAAPAAPPAPPAPPAPLAEPSDGKKPKKKKKKGLIIAGSVLAATLAVAGISSVANGSSDPAASSSVSTSQVEEVAAPVMVTVPADLVGMPLTDAVAALEALGLEVTDDGDGLEGAKVLAVAESGEVEEGSTITLTVEKKRVLNLAQENALESAQSYLKHSSFSRAGLIGQLEYEGYTTDEATWATDAAGADWNQEAAESAQSYLDHSSFSRDELADQLDYEEYSAEQIAFALTAVGY